MSESSFSVIGGLRQLAVIRYTRLIANSIIQYDYLITLGREVDFMWGSKWSLPKVLFFAIRYYTLGASIFGNYGLLTRSLTDQFCILLARWKLITTFICSLLAQCILQIRVYALYGRSRKILVFIVSFFLLTTAFSSWILGIDAVSAGTTHVFDTPKGKTCTYPLFPPRAYAFWIPLIAYEALLCTLVLYKGVQTFTLESRHRGIGRTLLNIMVRDSLVIFLVLCLTYVVGLVVWIKETNVWVEVPTGLSVAMSSVLGGRLILNLREAAIERGTGTATDLIHFSNSEEELSLP